MSNDEMLAQYGLALDEVFRLRALLAYEADVTKAHLSYKTFPKSRRAIAEKQVERMRAAAEGNGAAVYHSISNASRSFRRLTGGRTLTRGEWEATA